ncbi:UV radiation resistance protein/autophagy-related protein 14 [Filobasidium floriforme]|uniref:UV radiation resistance protein/autophagy-related protein 14 n=1 Tax=Filobasidium floriforme TaxID=5210 RepID=UPI001E8D26F6|nr:UV radiation resistance protein/autophagy-related protein 14 [Filobasidium floriforme]KAH8090407.1 UV radiation resistance protein/autophagy-related protein 14 [Filobasidium floriforme]
MDDGTRCAGCSSNHDLYCPRCLGEGLNNHAQAHHILQTQLSASKSRCEKILYGHLPSSSSSSVPASTNPTPTVSSLSTSSRSSASAQASTSTLASTLRPSPPYARLSGFLSPPPFSPPRPVSTKPSSDPNSTPGGLIHHRTLSSTHSRLSIQCRDLEAELDRVRRRNEGKQESLRDRRGRVAKRRANLRKSQEDEDKVSFPFQPQDISAGYEPESALITSLKTRLDTQRREDRLVQDEIRAARKVLLKEVVDVFGVRPCRPLNGIGVEDVDGSRVGKGDGVDLGREEWDMEIAGLIFPSPGGFTGYHSNHLNAILMHTLHLLHLLSTYLTTRLPFSWAWSESPGDPASFLPSSTAGFAVYPAEEGGRMVGRPVFSAGEGLAFGRAASVRRAEKRKEQTRPTRGAGLAVDDRNDDDAVFEEDEEDEEEEGTYGQNDPDQEGSWSDKEDLRLWKKKAVLYVSTSREKWKRRQNAIHTSAGVGRVDREGHPDRIQPEARSHHQHGHYQQQPKQPGENDRDGSADKPEKQPKRDKYQVKEDQMILGYAMLCYDVACLGWMNGVNLDLETSRSRTEQHEAGREEADEVDWDKVLNPLRVIREMVRSERLGESSHTPSIPLSTNNLPSKTSSGQPVSDPSIPFIPLPFSFSKLMNRATQAFDDHNQDGRTTETKGREEDLGGDDWDLV